MYNTLFAAPVGKYASYSSCFTFSLKYSELFTESLQLVEGFKDILCRKFREYNKTCTLKFLSKHLILVKKRRGSAFTAYSQCTFNKSRCKSYKFVIDDLLENDRLFCTVYSTSVPICHPPDEIKRRHIKSIKLEKKQLSDSSSSYHCEMLDNADRNIDSENIEDEKVIVEDFPITEDKPIIAGRLLNNKFS